MIGLAGLSGALLYDKFGNNMKKTYKTAVRKAKETTENTLDDIKDNM